MRDAHAPRYYPEAKGADIIFIGSPTSRGMAQRNMPLDAADHKQLSREFGKHDISITEFDYHPPVLCNYDKTRVPSKTNREISKACRGYLDDAIDAGNHKLAITAHADAISALMHKQTKVGAVRGIVKEIESPRDNGRKVPLTVIGITNPQTVNIREENRPTFISDVRAASALINADFDVGEMKDSLDGGLYEEVDDLQFLIDAEPEYLSFDIEAVGLRPYATPTDEIPTAGTICTFQFCIDGETGYTIPWDHPDRKMSRRQKRRIRGQMKTLLQREDTKVFGQNLKFDWRWVMMKLGFKFRIYDDTIMAAAMLDENSPLGQDDLVKRYVPEMAGYADDFNQGYDKGRMDLIPLTDIVKYGGGDVVSCFRLREEVLRLLQQDEKLYHNYRTVSMPAMNMFAHVDTQGMDMDMQAFSEFRAMMDAKVKAQRKSLLGQVPKKIRIDHAEKGLSFKRTAFVSDILFSHPKGFKLRPRVFTKSTRNLDPHLRQPSTSGKDHLPYFFDECPFTIELAQHLKDFQLLNNNIVKFEENFMMEGRIYPIYHLHKTVTGRTSSSDPNGQNIPKRGKYAKAYRRSFIPPSDEYIIMEADLSQAELRIAADMAGEQEMIRIYRQDGDIHRATAVITSGLTEGQFNELPKADQKAYRQKAKAVNFGFLYGMGWRTFITYAKTDYGVEFTDDEAQGIRNRFFAKYKSLPKWHKAMREYAHKNGHVRSYSGRVRHLPQINSKEDYVRSDAERQAINSPVQEFSSTLGVIAMTRMAAEIDPDIMRPLAFVHDAIFVLVRKEYVDWGARTLKWYMESNDLEAMFGRKLKLPIKADVSIGVNLGDQYELEGLTLDTPYDYVTARQEDQEYLDSEHDKKLQQLIRNYKRHGGRRARARLHNHRNAAHVSKFPVLPEQLIPDNNGMVEQEPYMQFAA